MHHLDQRPPVTARRRTRKIVAIASAGMCGLAGVAALAASDASAAISPEPVRISVGTSPLSVAAYPTTNMIYVANSNSFLTRQAACRLSTAHPTSVANPTPERS